MPKINKHDIMYLCSTTNQNNIMLGVITVVSENYMYLSRVLTLLLIILGVGFLMYYNHTQTRIAEDSIKIYNLQNQLRDWQRIAYDADVKIKEYKRYKEIIENQK